jgi:hypothetical protein
MRNNALPSAMIDSVPIRAIPEILKKLSTSSDADQNISISINLISRWARIEPTSAVQYAASLSGQQRAALLSAAASVWAQQDWHAASRYVLSAA